MIRSYTVMSIKDIDTLPYLDRAQFTLNSRVFPSKRNTVRALSQLNSVSTDIYVHYDYYRTLPRFLSMKPSQKEAMINEIADILVYTNQNKRIKGIVLHTDSPFRKELISFWEKNGLSDLTVEEGINKYVSSVMYDDNQTIISKIKEMIAYNPDLSSFLNEWYQKSTNLFYVELRKAIESRGETLVEGKVFLENSAHPILRGVDVKWKSVPTSVKHNAYLTIGKQDLLGVCWDLEHAFAADDLLIESDMFNLKTIGKINNNLLIHLNTIEPGVIKGSYKDRHSSTTIFDCGNYKPTYYLELVQVLEELKIPYIREVNRETMLLEQKYLKSLEE